MHAPSKQTNKYIQYIHTYLYYARIKEKYRKHTAFRIWETYSLAFCTPSLCCVYCCTLSCQTIVYSRSNHNGTCLMDLTIGSISSINPHRIGFIYEFWLVSNYFSWWNRLGTAFKSATVRKIRQCHKARRKKKKRRNNCVFSKVNRIDKACMWLSMCVSKKKHWQRVMRFSMCGYSFFVLPILI